MANCASSMSKLLVIVCSITIQNSILSSLIAAFLHQSTLLKMLYKLTVPWKFRGDKSHYTIIKRWLIVSVLVVSETTYTTSDLTLLFIKMKTLSESSS